MVEITQLGRFGIEDRETRKIVMGTHTGTHCDAPSHFLPGGATVDDFSLDALIGPAVIADFTSAKPFQEVGVQDFERELGDARPERVIMRFDWSGHWGKMSYYTDHPFISQAACQWLVDRGVLLLGMDTPMADNPANGWGDEIDSPNHKILLGGNIILVEYMCNLKELHHKEIDLIVLPLNILGSDGAPARCVGIEIVDQE
jgi:arylformamidase